MCEKVRLSTVYLTIPRRGFESGKRKGLKQPSMNAINEVIKGAIYGLLVADACGVPYEFHRAENLPPLEKIDMIPPSGFHRSYPHIPLGTWSDDGAQALCLWASLRACGRFHSHDFANKLLRWFDEGYMAVDNHVFDIGIQTRQSLARLKAGCTVEDSGMRGERNNGNGSLMRVLPLALIHQSADEDLVSDAHNQSKVTHAHPRSQICCALYCLWARAEIGREPDPYAWAVHRLRALYRQQPDFLEELEDKVQPGQEPGGKGSGYVVDSLHSARWACEGKSYKDIVQRAISLGNDTDTTACIAGGIAGIRHGFQSIPEPWLAALRGKEILATALN